MGWKMTEKDTIIDNRIHIRLKRHFVKHGKNIHAHIKKHHKKYLFWWALYGVSHILILKILALKLLFLKSLVGGLAFIGIVNPSLTDIFSQISNICINHKPIIAQQLCNKNFGNIQDAVSYLESMIDPETDNIYNAQYYGIVKSVLSDYCGTKIDKNIVDTETKNMNAIATIKNVSEKIGALKDANGVWKTKSLESDFSGEAQFCTQKYLAYAMLDLSKTLFLKELKKWSLLSPRPLVSGQKIIKKSDIFIVNNFAQWIQDNNGLHINYTLGNSWNANTTAIATIIKNISVKATDDSINALHDMNILTASEQKTIKDILTLNFISSCDKNQWYHRIKQYYNDKNVLQNTTLEKIQVNVWLCDSYQYIDQISEQVKKLVIHEIWHYVYYLKDNSTNAFDTICRSIRGKTKRNICNRDEFVSNYSQTSPEEDYAETFSRRALTEIHNDTTYLSYYRKNIYTNLSWSLVDIRDVALSGSIHSSAGYISLEDNALSKKFDYFDGMTSRFSRMTAR